MFKFLNLTKHRAVGILLGLLLVIGAALAYFKLLNFEISEIFKPLNPHTPETPEFFKPLNLYTNSSYGFSFRHPDGFETTEFEDENGEVILFEKDEKASFQIFITPFDEPGPLTFERVRKDLPNLTIEEPQTVKIANADALVFFSEDPSLGRLRESWFVWPPEPWPNGNYLYQVTSAAEFDSELSKIMATWKFE